jgi:putative hemolysin
MHTRFPVTEEAGNPAKIFGYVNFKDIVVALRVSPNDPTLRSLVRKMPTYDAEMSVADCLEHLMREHNHIALVKDKNGKLVGMVTMEDIVEELVGEIHDEFDRMPAHLAAVGSGWIAGGFVSLNQLRDRAGVVLPPLGEKPIYTLNDWIVEHLGRQARGGEIIETDHCRIVIRKTRRSLVQEALVSKIERQPAPAESETEEAKST